MAKKNVFHELAELISGNQGDITKLWREQQVATNAPVIQSIGKEKFQKYSSELLDALTMALPSGDDIKDESYTPVSALIRQMSFDLTNVNCTPSEIATFVFSLKDALLNTLQSKYKEATGLNEAVTLVNKLVDKIGLLTFEAYADVRENLIREQQRSLIETAAPVVKVWDKILMVPLVGILDSERTQLVMDKMLASIEDTQSRVVILDITGIPTVDTLVARHLISTATAVRLMGAECIVTGISARISQTIVQMGIDLKGINTKNTMAAGLREAFGQVGMKVVSR